MDSPLSVRALPWAAIAAGSAIAIALIEVADTFSGTDMAAFTLTYSALFLVGAVLTVRGHLVGLVLVGLLLIPEVAFVPFYSRSGVSDWLIQLSVGAIGIIGLVAVGCAVWTRKQSGRGNNQSAERTVDHADKSHAKHQRIGRP